MLNRLRDAWRILRGTHNAWPKVDPPTLTYTSPIYIDGKQVGTSGNPNATVRYFGPGR